MSNKSKGIYYFNHKAGAEGSARSIADAKVEKLPNGRWVVSRMNGVGNMRIKEYLRINGEVN